MIKQVAVDFETSLKSTSVGLSATPTSDPC